ncbi:MAG: MFS transporter [Desulfovibrionaceae bacterium]|nr:MFS transporter [Desulfovibrionaceae bacterium]
MTFSPPKPSIFSHDFVLYTTCGTFLYAICAGFRDNYGVMLPYIVDWSGLSHAEVSFIIALGQLLFGLMQPVFGLLALRTSNRFVLCVGSLMMLSGLALIPASRSAWMLTFSLGILLPSGTAAASFGIIMSCISPRLPPVKVHISSGFVASGIGIGICILSPLIQSLITARGLTSALMFLSIPVLLLIPISLLLTRVAGAPQTKAPVRAEESAADMLHNAFRNPVYRRLTFGFFTCGFHMALIQTHLFSQLTSFGLTEKTASLALSVYGLGVIAGSTGSGMACARFAMSRILGGLYISRCAWVILLLLPLPQPALFAVIFLLGMTGVATVAPTSGLVNKLFGPLRLATLFGLVYLVHQIGAFCSAWVGGLCLRYTGSYSGIWYADIALCLLAGLACLSIREHQNPSPEAA